MLMFKVVSGGFVARFGLLAAICFTFQWSMAKLERFEPFRGRKHFGKNPSKLRSLLDFPEKFVFQSVLWADLDFSQRFASHSNGQ